jgi:FG-GAP-like repeat
MDTGGFHSGSLAIGDFNGDGFPDIAVSNEMSNTISVFLNDGKGHFSNPIITPVQISALNVGPIAAGDLNEDGRTDLVLGTSGGSQANIALLSNGDGTFTQQPAISNSFGFLRARLVDLNGDKHLDLVAGGNGNMAVALGNGDGTFSPMTYLDNGPAPDSYDGIDVGDVNADGKLDIIGLNFTPDAGDIVIFLGNGNGTFQSPISQSSVSSAAGSVSAADFNGDGKLDLLVGYNPGNVLLFNGKGDGTFSQNGGIATDFSPQGTGSSVLAADMNKDSKPDALYANYTSGVFSIFLNSANGLSTPQFTETIAPGLSDIGTADFNRDGKPDVVLVNCQTNTVSVILTQ